MKLTEISDDMYIDLQINELLTYFSRFDCAVGAKGVSIECDMDEVFAKTGTSTMAEWEEHLRTWLRMERLING